MPANDLDQLARVMIHTAEAVDLSDAARLQRAESVSDCTPERFASDTLEAAEIAVRVKRNGRRGRRAG